MIKVFKGGAWKSASFNVAVGGAAKAVSAVYIRVANQWKQVPLEPFTLSISASTYNYRAVDAFVAKYGFQPPAGAVVELTVLPGVYVLGRAATRDERAPPAISFEGMPVNGLARVYVYGKVIGGSGAGGRPQGVFSDLQGSWENQSPANYARNLTERLNQPDACAVTGLGFTPAGSPDFFSKVVARFLPASNGVAGGDAVYSPCPAQVQVFPGGEVKGGGGGGAAIGHGYTKTFHTPPVSYIRSTADSDYIRKSSSSEALFMHRGVSDAPREWYDFSYERYNCRFVSYTLFNGLCGLPGAGALPLDVPVSAPDSVSRALALNEFYTAESENSITHDIGSLSFAPTTFLGVPSWPASATRYQQASANRAVDAYGNQHPYQTTFTPSSLKTDVVLAGMVASLPVIDYAVRASAKYRLQSMSIGGEYYNDDSTNCNSAASVSDSDSAAAWMRLSGRDVSSVGKFGRADVFNALHAVSQDTVVTRHIDVAAGSGGPFGGVGGTAYADVVAKHRLSANKLTSPADWFPAPISAAIPTDYVTSGHYWVQSSGDQIIHSKFSGFLVLDINYIWYSSRAKWMRTVGAFGRKVASLITGETTTLPRVADIRARLTSYDYPNTYSFYVHNLLPSINKSYSRPSDLSITVQGYVQLHGYTFSATDVKSEWTSASPFSWIPGAFLEIECIDENTPSLNFSGYPGFGPLRLYSSYVEQSYGSPMGAFAGLPVHACQVSLPGAGGKALARPAGSTVSLQIFNSGGVVAGGTG